LLYVFKEKVFMRKFMFKTLIAVGALAAVTSVVQAGTTTNNFNVTVTLTSQCKVTNDSTQAVDFGTYVAFQAASQSQTGTGAALTFRCTRGYAPISTAFDVTNGTAVGVGVLQGLQYTLTNTPVANAPGDAASVTTIGTGDVRGYTITGSMPADQAGACTSASCGPTTHVRGLIVTF
jgi:spore coat protein U-like protein